MIAVNDYYQNPVFWFSSKQLIEALEAIKGMKQNEIDIIKEKIKQFEQKRRSHEVWYQSLSPVRKFFAGRPPVHHQAVEYLVNVKDRFQQIEQINRKLAEINGLIEKIQEEPEMERIVLANDIIDELRRWVDQGGMTE
ncbi:hypothetical protein ACQYAD_02415 [Neobacillus sp. SM06]|uniref:hypothetical protein n=1 Tax=Neobacillus sp. SM06 TaxID=3422492 RepID=UPI003D2E9261